MPISLLLPFDGTDGATSTSDKSGSSKAVSFFGSAALSSTQKKYGPTSLSIGSGSDYLTTPSHADFAFSTGDFTVGAYIYVTSFAGASTQGFFNIGDGTTTGFLARYSANSIQCFINGAQYVATVTFSTGAFHHVEICRVSGSLYFFLDGVLQHTVAGAGSIAAAAVRIGHSTHTSTEYVDGFIDDLYINKGAGLHTTDFTPPAEYVFCEAAINGYAPTIQTYSGAAVSIAAPSPVLPGSGIFGLSCLPPVLFIAGGASLAISPPLPALSSTGHSSMGEQAAAFSAPSPTLLAFGGTNAGLAAPSPTLTTAGTVTTSATAGPMAPSPTLVATGTVDAMAHADITTPSPNLVGYSGAVCSITLIGGHTVQATGTSGGIGGATITVPLFELSASGTAQNYGSADLIAPSARLGGQAQAYLIAPGATLTAVGTATVTAAYEAYVLNLNHTPRKGNEVVNDEMTRYTNFPFTHVVRYQNSYFGANSTGLYLLEGTTDDGAPIEWEVKTAFTDFDSAQHKTLEMAYFGGRLGPEATISLFAGEQTTNPYEYTTPRGAAAQNYRQPFGRGQKARYYALGASGDDVVTIDSITLNVATLARKV